MKLKVGTFIYGSNNHNTHFKARGSGLKYIRYVARGSWLGGARGSGLVARGSGYIGLLWLAAQDE